MLNLSLGVSKELCQLLIPALQVRVFDWSQTRGYATYQDKKAFQAYAPKQTGR